MCYTNSMKQHIMIDLETLGTTIDSNILTIGALKFDPNEDYRNWTWGDFPKDQVFYRRVDPATGSNIGLKIDEDTLSWWAKQNDDVKAEDQIVQYDSVTGLFSNKDKGIKRLIPKNPRIFLELDNRFST